VFRPGLNALENIAETIATELDHAPPGVERIKAIESWMPRLEAGKLATALDAIRAQGAAGTLIVVDQFEEFFTADPAREAETARQRGILLPQLLAAALDREDVHCLLTARLDLIERMVADDKVAARMLGDPLPPFVLTAMTLNEVAEAVAGPAGLFGVSVDPALIAELAAETTRAEGRLPLLQAALRQAWSGLTRTKEGRWRVGRPDLPPGISLLDGAIRAQADRTVQALRRGRSDRPGIAEDDLRRVLLSLVRLEGGTATRRLLLRAEAQPAAWAILEALAEHRLVTLSGKEGTAELVHETVMTAWPFLADLIGEHNEFLLWRTRFDRDFLTWKDRGCTEEYMLRRPDLAIALDWLEGERRDRPRPSAAEGAFIAASRDHHDRRTRELEALLEQARAAEAAANEARNAALLQELRALAAFAQQESARGDHMTAVLLALEALPERGRGGDRPLSAEAAAAIRQTWLRNREICLVGHASWVRTASFSADGRHVVTASDDNTAGVWDLSGPRPVATVLKGHTGVVTTAAFNPDGRRVITASWDGTAWVWHLSGLCPAATVLEGHMGLVSTVAFSADGRRVITASDDHTARV
jgi:WD domain, G-beta repeat